jgi:hypothetical protein
MLLAEYNARCKPSWVYELFELQGASQMEAHKMSAPCYRSLPKFGSQSRGPLHSGDTTGTRVLEESRIHPKPIHRAADSADL